MSQKRIKVKLHSGDASEVLAPSYQEEIRREFEQVRTLIDELLEWAKSNAPAEVQYKLAVLKSFTMPPSEEKTN